MPKTDKVGFGIVGYGVIGPHHAKAISNVPSAELVAVCDIDPSREAKLRADGHQASFYTNLRQMLRKERRIQALCVCTYSGIHYQAAVEAARRGVHVLSEKPLDVTLDHMDRMIEACAKARVKLGCIFQRRTSPDSHLIRKAIQRRLLGRLLIGDCYQKYYRSPAYYRSAGWRGTWKLDGGGALMNQAVHGIDLLLWLMGDAGSVFSYSETLARDIEVEDTSLSVVRFKNGALGHIVGTTSVTPGRGCEVYIHGDRGTISLAKDGLKCHLAKVVKGVHKPEEVDLAQRLSGRRAGPGGKESGPTVASDNTALTSDGHTIQVNDMCQAILRDRQPMVPGVEARKAVELILAIYRSARTCKEVTLPLR